MITNEDHQKALELAEKYKKLYDEKQKVSFIALGKEPEFEVLREDMYKIWKSETFQWFLATERRYYELSLIKGYNTPDERKYGALLVAIDEIQTRIEALSKEHEYVMKKRLEAQNA